MWMVATNPCSYGLTRGFIVIGPVSGLRQFIVAPIYHRYLEAEHLSAVTSTEPNLMNSGCAYVLPFEKNTF